MRTYIESMTALKEAGVEQVNIIIDSTCSCFTKTQLKKVILEALDYYAEDEELEETLQIFVASNDALEEEDE